MLSVQALGTLASRHVGLLRGYSSYLANVLDHLEGFSNKQLQQVFNMFAALTAREPAASAAAAAAAGGAGGSSSAAAGVLQVMLQGAQAGNPAYCQLTNLTRL
jgi:hypothetical protein